MDLFTFFLTPNLETIDFWEFRKANKEAKYTVQNYIWNDNDLYDKFFWYELNAMRILNEKKT